MFYENFEQQRLGLHLDAIDLVERLMQYDPRKRMSAAEGLQRPPSGLTSNMYSMLVTCETFQEPMASLNEEQLLPKKLVHDGLPSPDMSVTLPVLHCERSALNFVVLFVF